MTETDPSSPGYNPTAALRSQILASDDITTATVTVPEWGVDPTTGSPLTLTVKSMTGAKRAQMLSAATDADTGAMDFSRIYPEVVIATVIDPVSGAYVFAATDADLLNQKNGGILERIAQAGMKVSGMGQESEADLGKSSSQESGGSTSS